MMRGAIGALLAGALLALPAAAQTSSESPTAVSPKPVVPVKPEPVKPEAAKPEAVKADPPREGMAKAWGELLADERAKRGETKSADKTLPADGRVLGVGTGPTRNGKAPALSESDKACQRSLQQLLADAEKNDAVAAFRVGVIYEEGCGVRRNRQVAAAYYELAGKNGHVEGNVRLGMLYADGEALGMDYVKARSLLSGPAAKGNPLANFHLGVMAYRGDDKKPAKPDIPAAMKYFKAAAEGGYAQAQFIVGQAHSEGNELPKDMKAAKIMLTRAANQGFAWAMVIVGRLHAEREFADADPAEAFKWLMIAKNGNPEDTLLQASVDQSLQKLDGKLNADQRGKLMLQVLDFKPKLEWEEKI